MLVPEVLGKFRFQRGFQHIPREMVQQRSLNQEYSSKHATAPLGHSGMAINEKHPARAPVHRFAYWS
jgi:hypothetical protein